MRLYRFSKRRGIPKCLAECDVSSEKGTCVTYDPTANKRQVWINLTPEDGAYTYRVAIPKDDALDLAAMINRHFKR